MCKCCEMCCSKRQNEDTMREAEHVAAHTVEATLAPVEHHNKEGCRDDCTVNALQEMVSCSHQERLNSVRTGAVVTSPTSLSTRMSGFRTCTSATSVTSTSVLRSRCWSLLNVSMIQPSHTAAQYCHPCKLRRLASKRSATMRGVDTGSGQLRLCRGSSRSACCMASGTS